MRLDIPTKASFGLCLWVAAFTVSWEIRLLLSALILLVPPLIPPFRPCSLKASQNAKRFRTVLLALAVLLVAVNSVFIREGDILFQIAGIHFYTGGLQFGLQTGSRILLLSLTILVLFASTSSRDMIHELQRHNLPSSIVVVLLLTLHFLQHLPSRIENVLTAQEARGAPVRSSFFSRVRALFSVLLPLIFASIAESLERGMALELRGLTSEVAAASRPKAVRREPHNPLMYVFLSLSMLLVIGAIIEWLLQ